MMICCVSSFSDLEIIIGMTTNGMRSLETERSVPLLIAERVGLRAIRQYAQFLFLSIILRAYARTRREIRCRKLGDQGAIKLLVVSKPKFIKSKILPFLPQAD